MLLADLVVTSRRVAETSKRLEKVGHLAELLARLAPDEVAIAVPFLCGALRQGRIGLGWATVQKAMPTTAADQSTLHLREVDATFTRVGGARGKTKGEAFRDLLARATKDEQEFLERLVIGELRQGALEGIMVEAVARAAGVKSAKVRRALMNAGDLAAVAAIGLGEGEAGLARFVVQLFRPLKPMLAQPADDVDGALDHLGEALLEYKLDGARIQVHKAGDEVRVYSRKLREVTAAVPEVVELVGALPARELICDGEVLALRPDGRPHPFQVTMRRFGRKLDVDGLRGELPLTPFLFDLLYVDGHDLIDEPQARRLEAMETLPSKLVIPRRVTASVEEARAFFDAAVQAGHEGIMAKALDAGYAAGGRGKSWLKVKPAHTLDLVVLAAEWGSGRRRGWLSNLHLGARNPEDGSFVMLGKTFKGMTDKMLAWQTERLLLLEIGRDGSHTVHVRPELVVEIAFNDLQQSPHYPGGLALRFARVKRYRPDKSAAQADTITTVREIFARATSS